MAANGNKKKRQMGLKQTKHGEEKKSLWLKMGHEGKRAKEGGGGILSEGKSQTESGKKRTNASMSPKRRRKNCKTIPKLYV